MKNELAEEKERTRVYESRMISALDEICDTNKKLAAILEVIMRDKI